MTKTIAIVLLVICLLAESIVTVHYMALAKRWEAMADVFKADDQKSVEALRQAVASYERCAGLPQRALEVGK